MLPNLSHSSSGGGGRTSPSWRAEVAELLEPRPGRHRRRLHVRRGRPRGRPRAATCGAAARTSAVDRDHEAERRSTSASPRAATSDDPVRRTATSPSCCATWRDRRPRPGDPDGPRRRRRCRSTARTAASATPTTRRSTCAWTRRPTLTAAEIVNTWDERELAGDAAELRRGALLLPDRPGDRPPPRRAAVRAQRRPGRGDQGGHPDAGPVRPGPSGHSASSRRCGSPRTTSSSRCARASSRRVDAARAGRADRRHQLPLARGPDRRSSFIRDEARGCTCPPDFPVCVCGHQPRAAHR